MSVGPVDPSLAFLSEIRSLGAPAETPKAVDASEVQGAPFANFLSDAVASSNQKQEVSDKMVADFASGKLDDIHGTMIAIKEADIELKMVANVRNKLVDAFNDLWRMSI
jgi:flagellar hook-basal body complex protein FliE